MYLKKRGDLTQDFTSRIVYLLLGYLWLQNQQPFAQQQGCTDAVLGAASRSFVLFMHYCLALWFCSRSSLEAAPGCWVQCWSSKRQQFKYISVLTPWKLENDCILYRIIKNHYILSLCSLIWLCGFFNFQWYWQKPNYSSHCMEHTLCRPRYSKGLGQQVTGNKTFWLVNWVTVHEVMEIKTRNICMHVLKSLRCFHNRTIL